MLSNKKQTLQKASLAILANGRLLKKPWVITNKKWNWLRSYVQLIEYKINDCPSSFHGQCLYQIFLISRSIEFVKKFWFHEIFYKNIFYSMKTNVQPLLMVHVIVVRQTCLFVTTNVILIER